MQEEKQVVKSNSNQFSLRRPTLELAWLRRASSPRDAPALSILLTHCAASNSVGSSGRDGPESFVRVGLDKAIISRRISASRSGCSAELLINVIDGAEAIFCLLNESSAQTRKARKGSMRESPLRFGARRAGEETGDRRDEGNVERSTSNTQRPMAEKAVRIHAL